MRTLVQFIDTLESGGKERQLFELVRCLSARGDFNIIVLTMRDGLYGDALAALPRVQMQLLRRHSAHDLSVFWRFAALCRQWRPDLVMTWHSMPAIYAIPAARALRIAHVTALIQDAPATLSASWRWRTQLAFACADAVVANSQAGARAYRAPPGTHIIGTGYDLQRLDARRTGLREALGLRGRLVVGMTATFSHFKDQPTLVRAALRLLARRQDVVFIFAGDGPTLPACQALVPAEQRDAIRFLGQFPAAGQPHVIEDLVDCFDIGVLATFTEGISNTVVEYMVLHKPVVASDGGAMSELLVDGETGFLVPPRDAAQLAARIEQLLDDAGLRQRMGEAGRRRIESAFLLERQVAKFAALYDALVPPGRSPNNAS